MTSLDDLFEPAEDHTRRARPGLAWAGKATLAAVGLGVAVAVVLYALGIRLWYPLLPAGILAALLLHRLVTELAARPAAPPRADGAERDPARADPDGLAPAVDRWHARLSRAGRWRSGRSLGPGLAELVDERLRQRHGFARASDPGRARALLGERLWTFLAEPTARTPPPREVAAMLTTVEEL